jgi:hypothetical protein
MQKGMGLAVSALENTQKVEMLYDLVSTNNLFKYFFPQLLQLESNLV